MLTETEIRPSLGETEEGEKDTGPEFVDPDEEKTEKPDDVPRDQATPGDQKEVGFETTEEYRAMESELSELQATEAEAQRALDDCRLAQRELSNAFGQLYELAEKVQGLESEVTSLRERYKDLEEEAREKKQQRGKLSPILNRRAISQVDERLREISREADIIKNGDRVRMTPGLDEKMARAKKLRECLAIHKSNNETDLMKTLRRAQDEREKLEMKMRKYKYERQHNTGQ